MVPTFLAEPMEIGRTVTTRGSLQTILAEPRARGAAEMARSTVLAEPIEKGEATIMMEACSPGGANGHGGGHAILAKPRAGSIEFVEPTILAEPMEVTAQGERSTWRSRPHRLGRSKRWRSQ